MKGATVYDTWTATNGIANVRAYFLNLSFIVNLFIPIGFSILLIVSRPSYNYGGIS